MTSTYRVISCVVARGCLLCPVQCILLAKLVSLCPDSSVLQGQTCLFSTYLLTSHFCSLTPYDEKNILFLVFILEGLHGTIQLLWHSLLGHRLGLLWCWMACLRKTLRSFCCLWDCTPKYCISDSFFDCEGYSISSKGLLPTVVDIMIVWIKFTHSHPF